jgi:hypothetical protein
MWGARQGAYAPGAAASRCAGEHNENEEAPMPFAGQPYRVGNWLVKQSRDHVHTIEKLIGATALTVMLVTVGLQPALAASPLPFRASYSGVITPPNGPPPVDLSGRGTASFLGASTNSGHIAVTGPASCAGGFAVRNDEILRSIDDGDQIWLTIIDQSCPIAPGVYHGVGTYTVTGGTGRFVGASGQGTFDGRGDFNQGTYVISFTGTISPSSGH